MALLLNALDRIRKDPSYLRQGIVQWLATSGAKIYEAMLEKSGMIKGGSDSKNPLNEFRGWVMLLSNGMWIFGDAFHPTTLSYANYAASKHARLDPNFSFVAAAQKLVEDLKTLPRGAEGKILIEKKYRF